MALRGESFRLQGLGMFRVHFVALRLQIVLLGKGLIVALKGLQRGFYQSMGFRVASLVKSIMQV